MIRTSRTRQILVILTIAILCLLILSNISLYYKKYYSFMNLDDDDDGDDEDDYEGDSQQEMNPLTKAPEKEESLFDKYIGGTKQMSPDEVEASVEQIEETTKSKLGVPVFGEFEPVTIEQPPIPHIPTDFKNIKPLNFRIYSHNIKNGGDHELLPGEQEWTARLVPLAASMRFNTLVQNSIITLQEVYKYQMLDIMNELNRHEPGKWEYYGRGRIDGDEIGEFVPILWKAKEWGLVYSDTIWLNEKDPRTSVQGWDAVYVRIASFVTLKHKETNTYLNVFNSHFDHIGVEAQLGSTELILDKMKEINQWPSFFCGDLNLEPNLKPHKKLTSELVSSVELVTPYNRYGHSWSSVTGFQGQVLKEGGQNIDYIFAPKYAQSIDKETECSGNLVFDNIDLRLYQYGMLHSKFNGRYISDHRPIVADYVMSSKCV